MECTLVLFTLKFEIAYRLATCIKVTLNNIERLNDRRRAVSLRWLIWPSQFGRKLVLGTRRNWPRQRQRRDRGADKFCGDEAKTRRWYVSRPRRRDRDHNPRNKLVGVGLKSNRNASQLLNTVQPFDSQWQV